MAPRLMLRGLQPRQRPLGRRGCADSVLPRRRRRGRLARLQARLQRRLKISPLGAVAQGAMKNFFPSAWKNLKQTVEPLLPQNWSQTGTV